MNSNDMIKRCPTNLKQAFLPFTYDGILKGYSPNRGQVSLKTVSRYDIATDVTNEATQTVHFNRSRFVLTGMEVTLGRRFADYPTSFGLNKRFIRDDGSINRNEITQLLTKECIDRTLLGYDKMVAIRSFDFSDCQLPLLYNMLVTWLMVDLKERQPDGNKFVVKRLLDSDASIGCFDCWALEYTVEAPFYEDSHCLVYGRQGFDKQEVKGTYVVPGLRPTTNIHFEPRGKDNYYEHNYVVRLPRTELAGQLFVMQHIGCQMASPHISAVVQTRMDPKIKTISIDGYDGDIRNLATDMIKFNTYERSSERILGWILSYVSDNRCNYEFSIALDLLFRLAYWPAPTSLESGLFMRNCRFEVSIPPLKPTRAFIPELLEGEEFVGARTEATYTHLVSENLVHGLLAGAIYNYVGILGITSFHYHEQGIHDRQYQHPSESPMLASMASKGQLFYNSWHYLFSMEIVSLVDLHIPNSFVMTGPRGLLDFTYFAKEGKKKLVMTHEVAAKPGQTLTGGLVDGAVREGMATLTHLASRLDVVPVDLLDGTPHVNEEQLMAAAQAHRILNRNITWCRGYREEEASTTWCPAHDWVVDAGKVWAPDRGPLLTVMKVVKRETGPSMLEKPRIESVANSLARYGGRVVKSQPRLEFSTTARDSQRVVVSVPQRVRPTLVYKVMPHTYLTDHEYPDPVIPYEPGTKQDFPQASDVNSDSRGPKPPPDMSGLNAQPLSRQKPSNASPPGGGTGVHYVKPPGSPSPPGNSDSPKSDGTAGATDGYADDPVSSAPDSGSRTPTPPSGGRPSRDTSPRARR
nr:MAG: capsid protein [Totiviridae sp.]